MEQVVYTIYWVNRRNDSRKEHGSYVTEEEAVNSIKTWWRIHKEHHRDIQEKRTNSGALEVSYGDEFYVYRIEKRTIHEPLPTRQYQLLPAGQIAAKRAMLQLTEDELLFDELPEPYRDRIIEAMADSEKAKSYCYTTDGRPVIKLSEIKLARQQKG